MPSLRSLDASESEALVGIWNAAFGADLRITLRFMRFNTQLPLGAVQAGRVATQNGLPVAFVLASALPNDPLTSPPEVGWIDALAVQPEWQRQGLGSELLAWAVQWLKEQHCTQARLGGSLRPFVAGYPVELGDASFFHKRGYADRADSARVWDVARDLGDYVGAVRAAPTTSAGETGERAEPTPIRIRPAQAGDKNGLLEFFEREFPNRWRFEYQEFLRMKGRISDWLILLTSRGVDGFARMMFEDSVQPYERFYPYRLPRPWGQLGPLGVSRTIRGHGCGRRLLDAAVTHLRERGVRGAVIDWTGLLDFYAKFGFRPFREYLVLNKRLQ